MDPGARNFIKDLAFSCAVGTVAAKVALGAKKFLPALDDDINAGRIPRWRGFNLQGNLHPGPDPSWPPFDEFDFS